MLPEEVVGKTFGWIEVIRPAPARRTHKYECSCRCGNTVIVSGKDLVKGRKKSCGCRDGHRSHGLSSNRTWNIWRRMVARCHSPREAGKHYQKSGITVCERWRADFNAFLDDMGEAPEGYSIDRIDNNGNYEPANCRWATRHVQARNRSVNIWVDIDGRKLVMKDVAAELGVAPNTIRYYVQHGLLDGSQPPKPRKKSRW